MPRHRATFPDLDAPLLLTDGGLETTLVFDEKLELPFFAAFVLLNQEAGRAFLERYYRSYADLAREHGAGILFDAPTWRANADWGSRLGYDAGRLADVNRRAVELLVEVRAGLPDDQPPLAIGGTVGPRADGYRPAEVMSADDAERYHSVQIETYAGTEVDFVPAMTLNYVDEAIGIARAARAAELPTVISFTVETDGRLPTGRTLGEAIEAVDRATDACPAFYMVNCAHPTHFRDALRAREPWTERLGGLRANASALSHAELDSAEVLDDGDPAELAAQLAAIGARMKGMRVFGGCCGTDHRHIAEIAKALRG